MDDRFKPKTTEAMFGWVVEEAGEVLAAIGKTQRHGIASVNPLLPAAQQEMNGDWVLREMWDLERALRLLRARLILEMGAVDGEDRSDVTKGDK